MSTVRQRLIDAIKVRLGGISFVNGYNTDAGLSIHEWRDPVGEPFEAKELPCISIRDESGQVEDLDWDTSEHSVSLEVRVLDQESDGNFAATEARNLDAPALARALEGDVLKAFGLDPTFGGLCHYFQLANSTTEVRQTGKRSAGIRMTFDVKFRVKAFDPTVAVPYPT